MDYGRAKRHANPNAYFVRAGEPLCEPYRLSPFCGSIAGSFSVRFAFVYDLVARSRDISGSAQAEHLEIAAPVGRQLYRTAHR
ncbi:MAG: hypothetical protein J6Z04_05735, partial [Clostridia bacterium]|nr:hypothetical protein [Clostridia bacterium]